MPVQSRASAIWCRKPDRKSVRRHRRRAMPKGALARLNDAGVANVSDTSYI